MYLKTLNSKEGSTDFARTPKGSPEGKSEEPPPNPAFITNASGFNFQTISFPNYKKKDYYFLALLVPLN